MRLLILMLSIVSLQEVYCQGQAERKIDSLERLLPQLESNDTMRIKVLLNLNRTYRQKDIQKSVRFAYQAIDLSKRVSNKGNLMQSYNLLGVAYGMKENLDSAMWAFKQTMAIAKETSAMKWLADAYTNIGIIYDYKTDYKASLDSYYKSLEIAEKINAPKQNIFGSIANAYRNLNDYKMSLHYDSLAIKEANLQKASDDLISLLMGNMANSLLKLNRIAEAKQILLQCIEYRKKTKENFYLANHYKSLAEINVIEKREDEAYANFTSALNLYKEVHNWSEAAQAYTSLAMIDLGSKKITSSKKLAFRSFNLSDSLKLLNTKLTATEMLGKIALYERDLKSAVYYDSIRAVLKDSINLHEQSQFAAELKTKYETEKKDKENEVLKLTQLSHEAELSVQRYAIIMIGVILMAVLVLLFVVYRSRQLFKKTNYLLKTKNEAIVSQQEEILLQKERIATQMEELRKTQSQLIHSEKMASLGQMTSGIAHEINNPLNFISGGVEGLKYSIEQLFEIAKTRDAKVDELEKETRKLVDSISNGVYRANKIATSLRTFSSPHSSIFTPIEITEAIEVALTMLNNKIAMRKINIIKEYASTDMLINGNSSELSQVFGNIIDNAIQAMESVSGSRKLLIRTFVKNKYLIVKIADSGPGIPPEIKEKIFEPFFTTKEAGKGTGLGLAISYGIIEKHNAKMTFENKPDSGAEFTLSFKVIES